MNVDKDGNVNKSGRLVPADEWLPPTELFSRAPRFRNLEEIEAALQYGIYGILTPVSFDKAVEIINRDKSIQGQVEKGQGHC